jgi:hypothetical protein
MNCWSSFRRYEAAAVRALWRSSYE